MVVVVGVEGEEDLVTAVLMVEVAVMGKSVGDSKSVDIVVFIVVKKVTKYRPAYS